MTESKGLRFHRIRPIILLRDQALPPSVAHMGANVTLTSRDFNTSAWCREAAEFLNSQTPQTLSHLCLQLFVEAVEEMADGPVEDEIWLHPIGGIRGVTLRFENGAVDLSLPTGSGAADWELAAKLATLGATHGAKVHFDEEEVAPGSGGSIDLNPLFQRQWEFEVSAITTALSNADKSIQLPVGGLFHLDIDSNLASSPALHDQLADKMSRYSSAFLASNMVFDANGREVTVNVAGAIPALVSSDIEMIAARSAAEVENGGFNHPLRRSVFFEIMGPRVEHLGPLTYVPELDPDKDAEIISRILAVEPDMPEPGESSTDEAGSGLTDEDQQLLDRSPVIAFLFVAAADGKVDRKELKNFSEILNGFSDLPPSMFKAILLRCLNEIKQHFAAVLSEEMSPVSLLVELAAIRGAIEKCPIEEQAAIRNGLYQIAHKIAGASGGFLGLGPKISKEERASLEVLAQTLGVDPESPDLG